MLDQPPDQPERIVSACRRHVGSAWLEPGAALALVVLLGLLAAACQALPGAHPAPQGTVRASPTSPAVSLIAGPPITITATTAKLPGSADGRSLVPVAAYGSSIIVAASPLSDRSLPTNYELWDPGSGSLTAIAGWQSAPGRAERVLGTSQDWALIVRDSSPPGSDASLVLRNLKTGDVRQLAGDIGGGYRPRAAIGDGWVAWLADAGGRSVLHVYALSTGTDAVVPARAGSIGGLALGNGRVAWAQSSGTQSPRIVLRELPSGNFQAVPTGPVTALALSSDGRSLVWLESTNGSNPGLFVRDLGGGTTERLIGGQGIGFGLSTSGPYVAWQPRPAGGSTTAGFYNLQTHELRVVQGSASAPAGFAAVMGNWFVWGQGTRPSQFGGAPTAGATQPAVCCYAVRLGP